MVHMDWSVDTLGLDGTDSDKNWWRYYIRRFTRQWTNINWFKKKIMLKLNLPCISEIF